MYVHTSVCVCVYVCTCTHIQTYISMYKFPLVWLRQVQVSHNINIDSSDQC